MLIVVISIFLFVSLVITQLTTLIPIHLFEAVHFPAWFLLGLGAIALSWFMGD
ncbi:MAG: hypothetical protein VKL39_08065 [Leptolyngbyaceae bacterium]|nr:hypothetical protein [Leptolyngbyaceae bacterium]